MIWYVIIQNARIDGVFMNVGYYIINKRRWIICDLGVQNQNQNQKYLFGHISDPGDLC